MSRLASNVQTILNASGNVTANNATYYSIDGCDQVMFTIDKTGSNVNIHLNFDLNGDDSIIVQENFTTDDQKVLDDPMGRVKAWCDGWSAGETAKVYMRKVYWQER
jgi:hypothetical protein